MSANAFEPWPAYIFGPFHLQRDGTLTREGNYLHLPPKELQVFRRLLASPGHLVSQDRLLDEVWPGGDVAAESLTRCIYTLRKTLGQYKHFIVTVYGKGYRFEGSVRQVAGEAAPPPSARWTHWQATRQHLAHYTPQSLAEASRLFRQALMDTPECTLAWCGLASSLIGEVTLGGRTGHESLKEVEYAVGRSLAGQPENLEAIVLLAFVISAQGSYDGAQALFHSAPPERAGPQALFYQAWHQWCWGMIELAEHTLEVCLEDLPHSLPAWVLLARLTFARAPEEALLVLDRARQQTDYQHPVLLTLQAMTLAFLGRAQAGRELLAEHDLDRHLAAEPGLLRCYVLARLDRPLAREAYRYWYAQQGRPALCPGQMCVLRVLEGDGTVFTAWRALAGRRCPWLYPQLSDPRLRGLSPRLAAPQLSSQLSVLLPCELPPQRYG